MDIKSIIKDSITKKFSLNMKKCIHSPQSEKKMVSICYLIGIVKLMYKSKDSLKKLVIRHEQAFHESRNPNDRNREKILNITDQENANQ